MSEICSDTSIATMTSPSVRGRLALLLQFSSPHLSRAKSAGSRRSMAFFAGSSCATLDSTSGAPPKATAHDTVSVKSFTDSLGSFSREPLLRSHSSDGLPPSGLLLPTPIPVPPTINSLDTEEKLRLMKKVRKLSRVLGEYPLVSAGLTSANPWSSAERRGVLSEPSTASLTLVQQPVKGRLLKPKSHRHSWTPGLLSELPPLESDLAAASSCNSPVPPLPKCLSPALSPPDSPCSTGSVCIPCPTSANTLPLEPRQSDAPLSPSHSRSLSTNSVCIPLGPTPEQMRRIRIAKLTRHLGNDVPPEVLFRAASPPPRASVFTMPDIAAVLPSQHSSGGNPRQDDQGVASSERSTELEVHNLDRPVDPGLTSSNADLTSLPVLSVPTPALPPQATYCDMKNLNNSRRSMRKTKSMWVRRVFSEGEVLREELAKTAYLDLRELSLGDSMNERDRVANVRRAKKMTQYFGDKPPPTLFQLTSPIHAVSSTEHLPKRSSLSTSLPTSSSLPYLDGYLLQDSSLSISESSMVSSTSGSNDPPDNVIAPGDEPVMNDAEEDAAYDHESITSELPYVTSLEVADCPATLSPQPTVSFHDPPSFPTTAAPFSDVIAAHPELGAPGISVSCISDSYFSTPMSKISVEFHTRQRRAAKLSKFFGVQTNALAEVLPIAPRKLSLPDTPSLASSRPPLASSTRIVETTHDAQKGARELDMHDAINKLRRMKVS